ncbi:MAG: ATP-dependent Clp protease ATP-binding subunit, partial [Nitrospinae bacterium]|nr:ATP-dependent Clp protease ATP-binding subunit [Nitrospinota bacterium]
MLQQYIRYFTNKVIESLNIGSVEMVNLHQNLLTPDFILIGLLEQEDSIIVNLIETSYPDDKNLSNHLLEKLYAAQEDQAKFQGNAILHIQLAKETET